VPLPEGQIGAPERLGFRDPRVVDQDVHRDVLGAESIERGRDGLGIGDVQHAGQGREPARVDDLAGHRVERLGGATDQHEMGAGAPQREGHRASDAPAAAGDERGSSLDRVSHAREGSSRAPGERRALSGPSARDYTNFAPG